MSRKYPMWHLRFTKARNLLGEACEEMEQAVYEDRGNPAFTALHAAMKSAFDMVDKQLESNFSRGKNEGWL